MRFPILLAAIGLASAGQIFFSVHRAGATTYAFPLAYGEARVSQPEGHAGRALPELPLPTALKPASIADQPSCTSSNATSPACYIATQQRTPEGDIFAFAQVAQALRESRLAGPRRTTPGGSNEAGGALLFRLAEGRASPH